MEKFRFAILFVSVANIIAGWLVSHWLAFEFVRSCVTLVPFLFRKKPAWQRDNTVRALLVRGKYMPRGGEGWVVGGFSWARFDRHDPMDNIQIFNVKPWKIMAIIIMAFLGHFIVKLYLNNIFMA